MILVDIDVRLWYHTIVKQREMISMQNVFDVLKERGFIEQTTREDEIRSLLADDKITF